MTSDDILEYCLKALEGTVCISSWGERGIFFNPGNTLKRGVYVLTVKEKDGENDSASCLCREGVYRVNLGVRKSTFTEMFGDIPKRPARGCTVDMNCDFSLTDTLLPHPVYAWIAWICILTPSPESFEKLKPLIKEAYALSAEKFRKRK